MKHLHFPSGFLALTLVALSVDNSNSQTSFEPMPHFGAALALGIPQNEFRQATDANGGGFNFSLNIPLSKTVPIYAGADYTYMLYGMNRKRFDLESNVVVDGVVVDQILIPLESKTSNNIHQFYLTLRAEAPFRVIRPYVQGMGGFRYLSTKTTLTDKSPDSIYAENEDGVLGKERQLGSTVWSWGYAGGLKIRLSDDIALDLRCDFLYGGKAKFYDSDDTAGWQVEIRGGTEWNPNDIKPENIELVTRPRQSTTDMMMFQLGLSFILH
jgi:opacity protein-like surface antigen